MSAVRRRALCAVLTAVALGSTAASAMAER